MECGHDAKELRDHRGWKYCRACKNEKGRKQWRETMKNPVKREEERKRVREAQRERRRNPKVRERDAEYNREYAARTSRLEHYKKYDQQRREDGTYYVSRYGVGLEDARQALSQKPVGCQICGRERPLVFDHCGDGKCFRGWLCRQCNAAIGLLGDDADTVQAALSYLLNFRQKI